MNANDFDHPWIQLVDGNIIHYTLPAEIPMQEGRNALKVLEDGTLRIKEPYGVVADLSAVKHTSATQRRDFGQFLQRAQPVRDRWCVGAGLVAPNMLVRGVLTAVFWWSRPHVPMHICDETPEAFAFVRAHMKLGTHNKG